MTQAPPGPPAPPRPISPAGPNELAKAPSEGWVETVEDQLAVRKILHEYMIPVETNTIWYTLGGVLGISLLLEVLTGVLLVFVYIPDAGRAYGITQSMLASPWWSVVLNFHYFNSYLIFALVMVHMMRVFISAGYRRGKQGLWLIGTGLAGVVFAISLTGEALHWDERGFAVPWHINEMFDAIGLGSLYPRSDLLHVPTATLRLSQIYGVHVAILPLLLLVLILMHYYLVKVKQVSVPFWHGASGRTSPFTSHMRAWLLWGGLILGVVLLLSIFWTRDAGPAPQLLPSSPYFGSKHGPGGLGVVPTYPISWTHGMNRFVDIAFGWKVDIWGTVIGMGLMLGALVLIPFVDGGKLEPANWKETFDLRKRGWAFALITLFWVVLILGSVVNAVTPKG